jgi:hypothetical protein
MIEALKRNVLADRRVQTEVRRIEALCCWPLSSDATRVAWVVGDLSVGPR